MITNDTDPDGYPYSDRFVLWVPKRRQTKQGVIGDSALQKISTMPEMKWLGKMKAAYRIWFRDWDIGGPHPVIAIADKKVALMFKMKFHKDWIPGD